MSESPAARGLVLVVLAGKPGTGKTTIGRRLAARLQAAYLRTDSIAGSVLFGGLTRDPAAAGRAAYDIAREVALENLRVGVPVLIDGVQATRERRASWRRIAETGGARLVQIEMTVSDPVEHRRRVDERQAAGYPGPTWGEVATFDYDVWNDQLDGARLVVDTSDAEQALARCLDYAWGVASDTP